MNYEKVHCTLCDKLIRKSCYKAHLQRHKNRPQSFIVSKYALTHDGLECQFCGKICKNRNSLCNHERLCDNNPSKQILQPHHTKHLKPAWNKGLTKETDKRVLEISLKVKAANERQKIDGSYASKHYIKWSDETKQRLREIALSRGFGGMHRNKNSIQYKNNKLNSTYELKVAQSLDEYSIAWIRPSYLPYIDNTDKYHTYTPDFYLPEYNVYLDPKNDFLIENINPSLGYKDVDKIRWVMEQNNAKILVLNKDQLTWPEILNLLN